MNVLDDLTLLCRCHRTRSYEGSSHREVFAMLLVQDHQELPFTKLSIYLPDSRGHDIGPSYYMWNSAHIDDDPWHIVEGRRIGQYWCKFAFSPESDGDAIDKYDFGVLDSLYFYSGFVGEMLLVRKTSQLFNQRL